MKTRLSLAFLSLPTAVFAHPGHSALDPLAGTPHPGHEWEYLILAALIALSIVLAVWAARRRNR